MIWTVSRLPGRPPRALAPRLAAALVTAALGLASAGCAGGGGSSAGPHSSGGQADSSPPAARTSTPPGAGSSLGDLSSTVDLSLGGSGFPLTMKAPAGSAAIDDGDGAVGIAQSGGGHFYVDVFKITTPFATVKEEFQEMAAPYAFVKFTLKQPNALIYEIHNTEVGEPASTFEYSAYVLPASAPGYYCTSHSGSTDMTLLSEQGAEAVVTACNTLTSK